MQTYVIVTQCFLLLLLSLFILIIGGQLWWYFTFLAACHCLHLCVYLIVCHFTDMANKLTLSLSVQLVYTSVDQLTSNTVSSENEKQTLEGITVTWEHLEWWDVLQVISTVTTLQTLWNSLTIRGTPDHFNWYSYHACTSSVKVNDQTVKFIFNNNEFIRI